MPDKVYPYRERPVRETPTVWSAAGSPLDKAPRGRISPEMHQNPAAASPLECVRTHPGFSRRITVTDADEVRLSVR
jgi:hypothetical protein